MRPWGSLREVVVGLIISAGVIGFQITDAFALAGKMTGTPPGAAALSGGRVTVVLDEPVNGQTEFASTVGPNGEVDFPPGVDPNRGSACRYTDETGKTVTFRCGGYFALGSGAIATGQAAGIDNGFKQWLRGAGFSDVRFLTGGGGGFSTTNVGGKASSNLGALGNFQTRNDYGRLPGGLARFGAELGVPQIMGVNKLFFGLAGTKFWGRDDSFRADLDPISAGQEATSKYKTNYAIDAYVGKRFPFACGKSECTFSGRLGGSLVSTKNVLTIQEAGVMQTFKDTNRDFALYWGGSVEVPVAKIAPGTDLLFYLSADFRRISGSSMTARSQLGLTYSNSYCSYVDFNPTAGFVLVFDP